MNLKPEFNPDPADLDGLDRLLDKAHIEVVERQADSVKAESTGDDDYPADYQDSAAYVDMRITLELIEQVQQVRELLSETNGRLTTAYSRVRHLQQVVSEQEKRLELLPAFQKQADRALELQEKLDDAIKEIERLRQPWWHKFNNKKTD